MSLRRFQQVGARFVFPLDNQPLQEARDRHTPTGTLQPGLGPWGPFLTFGGTNEYITLSAAWEDQLRFDNAADDFSLVAWVRRAATGAYHFIMSKEDANNDGWRLVVGSGDTVEARVNALQATSTGTITDTLWHCVAMVVDRSASIQLYIDGAPDGSVVLAGPAMATTVNPRIGVRAFDGNYKWVGDIASLVILPWALSAAEALGLATGRAF